MKETIRLDRPGEREFRFKISAKGGRPRLEGGHIVFGYPDTPSLFRLDKPTALDALGEAVEVRMELKEKADMVLLHLDKESAGKATYPIDIDPTVIGDTDADPAGFSGASRGRFLFPTVGEELAFFHRTKTSSGSLISLRTSQDKGATWLPPITLANLGSTGNLAITANGLSEFFVAYSDQVSDSLTLKTRRVLRVGNEWQVSGERVIANGGITIWPNPTIAVRAASPGAVSLIVGFTRYDVALGRFDYVTAQSEDSGENWSLPFICDPFGTIGTVAVQGSRTICISGAQGGVPRWRTLIGATWSAAKDIPVWAAVSFSTLSDQAGNLHLVTGDWQDIYHSTLGAAAEDWGAAHLVGKGYDPTIARSGSEIYVFAADSVSTSESWIRTYHSKDWVSWVGEKPLAGHHFRYVLDYNKTWALSMAGEPSDMLFGLSDSQGTIGNQIGTKLHQHILDSPGKKIAFSFVTTSTATANSIIFWAQILSNSLSPPSFRVGLQEDASSDLAAPPTPKGSWINQEAIGGVLVTGTYSDFSNPVNGPVAEKKVLIPSTALQANKRYHIVFQPSPDSATVPDSQNLLGVQTVGAAQGADPTMHVLDLSGSSWISSAQEVPRFRLLSDGPTPSQQTILSAPVAATEYSIPGQFFQVPRDITPETARVYLTAVGKPYDALTIRIYGSGSTSPDDSIWSTTVQDVPAGWVTVSVSGVTLQAGNTYRLAVDSGNRDNRNFWMVGSSTKTSGSGLGLWVGSDRPGFNDRTPEAQQSSNGPAISALLNSSLEDAFYVGDPEKFDFIALTRAWGSNSAVQTAIQYWNGFDWTPLATDRSFLGSPGADFVRFTPPSDWHALRVNGRLAYWVRVVSTGDVVTGVNALRISSIGKATLPIVSEARTEFLPLVYSNTTLLGMYFIPYVDGSIICVTCRPHWCVQPQPQGNSIFPPPPTKNRSWAPSVSGDGQRVALVSDANLASNPLFEWEVSCDGWPDDVFVVDQRTNRVTKVSQPTWDRRVDDMQLPPLFSPDGLSGSPSISSDGNFVAFDSAATNLVIDRLKWDAWNPGDPVKSVLVKDENGVKDVFLHDLVANTTTRIPLSPDGTPFVPNNESSNPSISADGRRIAFESLAGNLPYAGGSNGKRQIYVYDTALRSVSLVSVNTSGVTNNNPTPGNGDSINPKITADGNWVVFESTATDLVSGDTNGVKDVFIRQLGTDALSFNTYSLFGTRRASVSSSGSQANGPSSQPSFSPDGGYIAFASNATNLDQRDGTTSGDVYLRTKGAVDWSTGDTTLISITAAGGPGNGDSAAPAVSGNGLYVAFQSKASNLVATNAGAGSNRIFVRDVMSGSTSLLSHAGSTTPLGGSSSETLPGSGYFESLRPSISASGLSVAFDSAAPLAEGAMPLFESYDDFHPPPTQFTLSNQTDTQDVFLRYLRPSLPCNPTQSNTTCWSVLNPGSDLNGLENFYPFKTFELGVGNAYVNMATRGLSVQQTDIDVPASGLGLRLVRTFNSADSSIGVLGKGWTLGLSLGDDAPYQVLVNPFTAALKATGNQFQFKDGDGTVHSFVKEAGIWMSPPGVDLKISDTLEVGIRRYQAVRPDGVTYDFRSPDGGNTVRLESVSDRRGNSLTYTYRTDGLLDKVTDTWGRYIQFAYVGAYLVSATYHAGGQARLVVEYAVDGGSLVTVTQAKGTAGSERILEFSYGTNCNPVYIYSDHMCIKDGNLATTRVGLTPGSGQVEHIVDRSDHSWSFFEQNAFDVLDQSWTQKLCIAASPTEQPHCVEDPEGNIEVWSTSERYNLVRFQDAGDELEGSGQLRKNTSLYSWGANLLIQKRDEVGNQTDYRWNANLQLDESTFTGNGEASVVTDYQYTTVSEGVADLTGVVAGAGSSDPRIWSFGYDGSGNLTSVKDPSQQVSGVNTTFTYYQRGLLKSVTDARQKTTLYGNQSDPLGSYHASGQPTSITDPTEKTKSFAYDDLGNLKQVTDRDGQVWKYSYDLRGNLLSEEGPPTRSLITTHCYDKNDNEHLLIKPSAPVHNCTLDGTDGHSVKRTYNALDHVAAVVTASEGQTRRTEFEYYPDGMLELVREPRSFDGVSGNQLVTYTVYPNNRLKEFVNERGTKTNFYHTPNGHIAKIIEPLGSGPLRKSTSYTYTGRGQVKFIQELGKAGAITYEYSAHGERTKETSAAGRTTTFVYDKMGRPTAITHPDGSPELRSYDSVGNLASLTQPAEGVSSVTANYTYTDRNEIFTEIDPHDPSHVIEYEYWGEGAQKTKKDRYGGVAGQIVRTTSQTYYPEGWLASTSYSCTDANLCGSYQVDYGYDNNGNRDSITTKVDGVDVSTISAGYTTAGEIDTWTERITTWDGSQRGNAVTYDYFRDGTLRSRSSDSNLMTMTYDRSLDGLEVSATGWWTGANTFTKTYFDNGQLESVRLPNTTTQHFVYDQAGRVSSKQVAKRGTDGTLSATLASWDQVVYDDDDYRTAESVTQVQPDNVTNRSGVGAYTYSARGFLASSRHPFEANAVNYAPDRAGNSTSDDSFTFWYSRNRLSHRDEIALGPDYFREIHDYGYDSLGSMRTDQVQGTSFQASYLYDAAGHNQKVTVPDGTWVELTYDGLDRLIRQKTSAGAVTYTFYDGPTDRVILEHHVSYTRYALDSQGEHLAQQAGGVLGYFITDLRGNLSQVLDSSQQVKSVFHYDPFGKEKTALTKVTQGWDSRLRYQMAPLDQKTGAYSIGPRLYDPKINRFVGADPYVSSISGIELQLDTLTGNRYLYAGANPANMIDDGHGPFMGPRPDDSWYGEDEGAWQEQQAKTSKKKAAKRKPAPASSSPRILADGSYDVTKLRPSAEGPAGYTGSPNDLNWDPLRAARSIGRIRVDGASMAEGLIMIPAGVLIAGVGVITVVSLAPAGGAALAAGNYDLAAHIGVGMAVGAIIAMTGVVVVGYGVYRVGSSFYLKKK